MTRTALLLLLGALGLTGSGCATLAVADMTTDLNHRRQAEAISTGAEFILHLPERGDSLDVQLADGRTFRGAYLGAAADTLRLTRLGNPVALPLDTVEEVRRPWQKARLTVPLIAALAADVAFFYFLIRPGLQPDLSGGFNFF